MSKLYYKDKNGNTNAVGIIPNNYPASNVSLSGGMLKIN